MPDVPRGEPDLDEVLDDVTSMPSWLRDGPLLDAIRSCDADDIRLSALYRHYDRRAVRHYRAHMALMALAAFLGFAAVVCALFGLPAAVEEMVRSVPQLKDVARPATPARPAWGLYEFGTMALAAAAVSLALLTATAHGWLLNRHRTERLRRLKYAYLTSPALWAGNDTRRQQLEDWLRDQIQEIRRLTRGDLDRYVDHESGSPVEMVPDPAYDRAALESLRRYYREMRLWSQRAYLARRSEPRHVFDRLTRKVPQALFFIAAITVLLHFPLERLHWISKETAVWLVVAAVGLPAFGAAIRTFRVSNEFDRNRLRSRAKAIALAYVADLVRTSTLGDELFEAFAKCEAVIESDHREWLRLMIEAEWFG